MVTQKLSWTVVGACWLSAGILGSVPMFGWYRRDTVEWMEASNSTTITCTFMAVIPMSYMVKFNFFACVLPPMLLMTVLYVYIFIKMQSQLRRSGTCGSESRSYYQKERKLTRSLALILALFAVCWLPLHFMNVITFYCPQSSVPHEVFYVGILLSQANSAINPVIYALKIQQIQANLKSMWKRLFLCKTTEDSKRDSQTPGNDSSSNPNRIRLIQDMTNMTTDHDN